MTRDSSIARPVSVRQAVVILYASLGLGIVRSSLEAQQLSASAPLGFVFAVALCVLVLMALIVYLIGSGKSWARMVFLVLFLLGCPLAVRPLLRSLEATPVSGILGLLQIVMQLLALVLLFQRSASNWFKAVKLANRTA